MLEELVEDGKMEWIEEARADKNASWDRANGPSPWTKPRW